MMWRTLWRRFNAESGFWKTICIACSCLRSRLAHSGASGEPSSSMIEPSSGTLRPSSTRARVVLPEPDSPTRPEGLACFEVEVDPDDGAHVLATDVEGLRHTPQADHRLTAPVRAPQRDVLRRRSWQLRRLFVIVAARGPPCSRVVHRWRLFEATLARERTALCEDATDLDLARPGKKARDGVEATMVLALAATRHATQQPDCVRVPGVVEDLPRRPLLDELAGVHDPDPVAHLRDHGEVVADEEHRGLEPLAERRHEVEDLGLDRGVERGRRLVEYEQRGLEMRAPWRS